MQRFNAAGRRAAPGRRRAKDKENWLDAKRIARELERVLEASGSRGEAIGRAAAELRLSTRQIYGLLARYRDERTVSSVLARSKTERKKRLAGDVETIVASTLQEQWLIPEAPPLALVVAEIQARCEEAACARRPIRRPRPRRGLVHARGHRQAALGQSQPFAPAEAPTGLYRRPASAGRDADRPHANRHPIRGGRRGAGTFVRRAYLTILVDVCTRCILGFCLTLEAPSTLSVALCLAHAVAQGGVAQARGLAHAWPTFGRPKQIVTDSAREFKGAAFGAAAPNMASRSGFAIAAGCMKAAWSKGCSAS